jgi:hypothetical protein
MVVFRWAIMPLAGKATRMKPGLEAMMIIAFAVCSKMEQAMAIRDIVNDYVAKGGKITVCPAGKRTL